MLLNSDIFLFRPSLSDTAGVGFVTIPRLNLLLDADIELDRAIKGYSKLTEDLAEKIPRKISVERSKHGKLPGVFGGGGNSWYFSKSAKDVLDEMEPGTFDWIKIDVKSAKTDLSFDTYYQITRMPQVDAINDANTDYYDGIPGPLRASGLYGIELEKTHGRHFWRGYPPAVSSYFCSDVLRERFKADKLDGALRFTKCRIIK